MTIREQEVAKLAKLRTEVEVLAKSYNAALLDSDMNAAAQVNSTMDEKVNEYTATARRVCFGDCKVSENPMLTAVKMLTFKTIATKDEKIDKDDKASKATRRVVIEKDILIDLARLDKFCEGIGADSDWMWIAEKMNFLLTAREAVRLGQDPSKIIDNYLMRETSKQINMGKHPTSNTNILRTLQMVVTAMVGDGYKATSHDVNWLLDVYAKDARNRLGVVCANHDTFRRYLAKICHRIVTNADWHAFYQEKKA